MLAYLSRRPWRRALAWLCFLGPFFFLTYGFANHHTASLENVGSFVFAWEKHIPFWAWTILPYWSIDFFYGFSLFLFTDKRELDRHAFRLMAATFVCVAGFLLFPLRFSFDRPDIVQPAFRWMFDALAMFDMPYNQAPSLHLCLLVILWDAYRRHASPRWRTAVHGWALLIGVSVFTTYQHHIIDGITGIPAGILCCYCIPLVRSTRVTLWKASLPSKARTLATRYAIGGILLAGAAYGCGGWMWLLLWPALCLWILAVGYLRFGPSVFRKIQGMSPDAGTRGCASRVLLAPYEWGARVVRRLFFAIPPPVEVVPGLWLGGYPETLPVFGCGVLDLAAEYPRSPATCGSRYASLPLMDLLPPDTDDIATALAYYAELRPHGPVLVHCALGMTRSAATVACILVREGYCPDMDMALAHIRTCRPGVTLSGAAAAHVRTLL